MADSPQNTPPAAKPFGHGSKSSDVAHVIGAYAGEDKARAQRAQQPVRIVKSRNPNEPPTIFHETIAQMRARVKQEREAAEPTAFQRSLIGARPGDASVDEIAALDNVSSAELGTTASGATASSLTTATSLPAAAATPSSTTT